MEKCGRFLVDASGQIQRMIGEISCDPVATKVVEYFEWNFWTAGLVVVAVFGVLLTLWILIGYPRWNVWASKKSGEAQLQEAMNAQRIQLAEANARKEAATINKEAAIIEAEAVSEQIEKIGQKLTAHDLYLKWQWIEMMNKKGEGSVIYVPTEVGLPILEAGKRS